ncbi:MAG: DNA polymerase IV [Pseudomonadota bacterium]
MILHVDMDAFYASVEERENPSLLGKPVIVGGAHDRRGVVSAANYVARRFGVRSAMPTATALRLCPNAIVIPGRMALYAEVSSAIHAIFRRYTPLVETLALDEAFLDVDGSRKLFGSPVCIGRRIKADIQEDLGLVASVGVAPSKFVAKIASDLDKPDGFVHVSENDVSAFLAPLPIRRLWGVGRATAATLESHGIATFNDVRNRDEAWLEATLGAVGSRLWALSHGIDDRAVVPSRRAKSISHETTFAVDDLDERTLLFALQDLSEQVSWRLRNASLRARTVQVKVRYGDFKTVTRAMTLSGPTDQSKDIWVAAKAVAEEPLARAKRGVRLLGVGVSNLERPGERAATPEQVGLFDTEGSQPSAQVDRVVDEIRSKFGRRSVSRGGGRRREHERG